MNERKPIPYPIFFIALVIVLAYWLVSFQVFSLRNDQILFYLPARMYLSDAFRNHEFLLWNPYLSGSYPMHCDMQANVWNPVVMVLSFLFKYNATLLSVEFLLYYIIGAVGCYYFARQFSSHPYTHITLALVYGCGGFAISNIEFMTYVTAIAYLPWLCLFSYQLLVKPNISVALKLSLSLWLILVSGYPSFLIFFFYIFIAAFFVRVVSLGKKGLKGQIVQLLKFGSLAFVVFLLLALPAIISFYEFLPFYVRGKGANIDHLNSESFSFTYPASLVFPAAMLATFEERAPDYWFQDTYLGLLPLFALCVSVGRWRSQITLRNVFLAVGCLLTFLFTLGRSTPVRMWCADYVPLLNTFGFSHTVRVFMVFAFFIWMAPVLDSLYSGKGNQKKLRYFSGLSILVLSVFLLIGIFGASFETPIKHHFYFWGLAWQFILLLALLLIARRFYRPWVLFGFLVIDLFVSVCSIIPITGLSRTKPAVYNAYASEFYQSDPERLLKDPSLRTDYMYAEDFARKMNAAKVVPQNIFASNTRLDSYYQLMSQKKNHLIYASKPFVFPADSNDLQLSVERIRLGYNHIDIDVAASDSGGVVLLQNYYPRWRSLDKEHPLGKDKNSFMQVGVRKGMNHVRLSYYANDLWIAALVSLACLMAVCSWLFWDCKKRKEALAGSQVR